MRRSAELIGRQRRGVPRPPCLAGDCVSARRAASHQTSVTARTVMHRARTPPLTRFQATFWLSADPDTAARSSPLCMPLMPRPSMWPTGLPPVRLPASGRPGCGRVPFGVASRWGPDQAPVPRSERRSELTPRSPRPSMAGDVPLGEASQHLADRLPVFGRIPLHVGAQAQRDAGLDLGRTCARGGRRE